MFKSVFLLIVIIMICSSCEKDYPDFQEVPEDDNAIIGRTYIENENYTVIMNLGLGNEYILLEENMREADYMKIWVVQDIYPDEYFNKVVRHYKYLIEDHPHDNVYGYPYTYMVMMICEEEVIGGYSIGVTNEEILVGGVSPIDGDDQKLHMGMTYSEWLDEWQSRYRDTDVEIKRYEKFMENIMDHYLNEE